jgi:peptidoglycan/xylan/chitin deacetylase (PgdA/CDA1 family)
MPADAAAAAGRRATVTLSFDNGPEPAVTPLVLEVLRRRGLAATFFVLGHKLAAPGGLDLARRAAAEGHWIGNHTWSHATPLGALPDDPAVAEAEIARTEALIGDLAHPDRLFRPFGGGGRLGPHLLSPAVLQHLQRHRYTCVLWNAVPGDWHDPEGWVDRALAQVAAREAAGEDVLLVLHDLPSGAMRHLDRFLNLLADCGHGFRQAFPESCLPLRRGVAAVPLDPYVTPARAA